MSITVNNSPGPNLDSNNSDAYSNHPSYGGYEYQILATVWIGLELISSGRAEAIIVEPVSNEDVEAKLQVLKENAFSYVEVDTLQIQIKLRNGFVWNPDHFYRLLANRVTKGTRGPAPRKRPLSYLKHDPSCRYLLLTNADVNKGLSAFRVSDFGVDSNARRVPRAKADDPDIAKRIGILPCKNADLLNLTIREILLAQCHISGVRVDGCVRALMDQVRERLLGNRPNRFPAHEFQNLISIHGGSFHQLANPVFPKNYGAIEAQLLEKHSLVLVGEPGTGKTTLANYLVECLQARNPPAARLNVGQAADVETVRHALTLPHDHVFYFEDPWGQETPGPYAEVFTSELPKLMSNARAGKSFVVTTRLGVFYSAVGISKSLFMPHVLELHPCDYDREAYRELYNLQIKKWTKRDRRIARQHRIDALKLLDTPYAVKVFCQELLPQIQSGKRIYSSDVERIAKNSNVNTFGAVLMRRIVAGGDDTVKAAVALWAQIECTPDGIDAEGAKQLRGLLRDGGMADPPDVLRLFNELANARWFQPRNEGYVTTPSVREALGQLETKRPAIFEDTITALLLGWANARSMMLFSHVLRL